METGISVSVKDNGRGIPDNMIRDVFKRFFRVSHTQMGTSRYGVRAVYQCSNR
ncbi:MULTISPECIES: ATP-binding protein [Niastella]|uniref:ATP-binding protein n=1 Tax=Niastella TaxID=354354 RepID=UPI003605EADF